MSIANYYFVDHKNYDVDQRLCSMSIKNNGFSPLADRHHTIRLRIDLMHCID